MVRDALTSFDGGRPAARDLERIAAHVRRGLDRSRVRGLAMFSCESAGLWQGLELARLVEQLDGAVAATREALRQAGLANDPRATGAWRR